MSKFYTSQGDQGKTDQLGKKRISKSHIRIQTVGSLDEASAALGFARAHVPDPAIDQLVRTIQTDLYRIMSIVVLEEPDSVNIPKFDPDRVSWLESEINHYGSQTETPKDFILPGENLPSGAFGLARTVIRRAERDLVALDEEGLLFSGTALSYLNRLSSLIFVIELLYAQHPPSRKENPS